MYYRGGMKWEEYLEHQGFNDNVVHGLERQTYAQQEAARQIANAQWEATREIMTAQQESTHALYRGFGALIASQTEMTDVMLQGFGSVSYGLDRVKGGIQALRSDFNWAMGAVLWKLEMQQATLNNILATLQAPLDTQAKELRQRAEYAYLQGWYDEALTDFLDRSKRTTKISPFTKPLATSICTSNARPIWAKHASIT